MGKTFKDLARIGGQATAKKYGKEHYSKAGKKGVEGKLKKYGENYYKDLAKKGLEARRKKKLASE